MLSMLSCLFGKRKGKRKKEHGSDEHDQDSFSGWNLFINLAKLEAATNGFSDENRLGQGGFGPVYKGVMPNGKEIAVKKLSLNSRQGLVEFTNEVRLLLKVQHRNLISLLGCCAEGKEKMLIYEYLPNRSLDYILFNKQRSASLDWSKRFEIIMGIAKGLLYLHEESPVKIIHRDIKASNVLLDENFNPKISDFGMARLFQGDDTHINTFKISGTYGYMAPEYALNGYLSVKTDVFSFGILVLEIVSGRKSLDQRLEESKIDLLTYAWQLSQEGKALDMVDSNLSEWDADEAILCIQIGLLCCQATISERPDMASVRVMLSSSSFTLPKPGRPGTRGRSGHATTTSSLLNSTNTSSDSNTKSLDTSKASVTSNFVENYSRNSMTVSFTTVGR